MMGEGLTGELLSTLQLTGLRLETAELAETWPTDTVVRTQQMPRCDY